MKEEDKRHLKLLLRELNHNNVIEWIEKVRRIFNLK